MTRCDLVIIGAGPAGMTAAIEAVEAGVRPVVLDEYTQPGGQIYRQLPPGFAAIDAQSRGKDVLEGGALVRRFLEARVDYRAGTQVWGVFGDKRIGTFDGTRVEYLQPDRVIIAVGAYDRPVPVPDWTLPGVLSAGGAQIFLKSQRVLPGRRVLVAGTGPLLLVVAAQFLSAGVESLSLCELSPMRGLWRHAGNVWGHWQLLWDGWSYLSRLRRAGIRIMKGHVVTRILGKDQVEGAVIAPVDGEGRVRADREVRLSVDAVCLGYGLIPSTELTRLYGCQHIFSEQHLAWAPACGPDMETSVPGVFVAGDCSGVAGVYVAREEGRIAALAVARQLGRIPLAECERRLAPIRARLHRLRRFCAALDAIYPPRRSLVDLLTDDTIVCRCEEVRADAVRSAIADGARTPTEVKAWTGAGMGRCQGRMCAPHLGLMLAKATGSLEPEQGHLSVRPPIKPIELGKLVPALRDLEVETRA